MRWPWSRDTETSGGEEAHRAAERSLEETRARWPEVLRVSASLRDLRHRNHFAELIEQTMRVRRD